jgi:hypothetical protein
MPSTHDPYRIPGTKPKRNPWLAYIPILVVLAAVAFAVGFLARNPHFFGWLGAQLEQPKAPQEAAAPQVPTPAPVNPQDPTTYLDLVKYDPATLPPDQARIASALIKKAMVLDRVQPDEVAALQVLDKEVFAPLRAAKNETDLAGVRSAAQKLGEACQKTRDFMRRSRNRCGATCKWPAWTGTWPEPSPPSSSSEVNRRPPPGRPPPRR